MATTSFLYHMQGLVGYRHLATWYRGGAAYHAVELREDQRRCRNCGAGRAELVLEGRFERTFRALPSGRKKQYIVLRGHEQRCRRCQAKRREPIRFANGKSRHTKAFERLVVELCRIATIKHVARWLGMSWTVVKEIFKDNLRKRLKRRSLRKVRYIAVDEFEFGIRQKFVTLVLDLETGEVLHVAKGRDSEALAVFLRRLKRAGAKLQAIAMDMWPAYLLAARQAAPGIPVVHDRYHVVAKANDAIDEARRQICHRLKGEQHKIVKGTRFLLLRAGERLDNDQVTRLERLKTLNEPLFVAYLLKEELRLLWSLPSKKKAKRFLNSWIKRALASGLRPFIKLTKTLRRHRKAILAYYNHRISTGPLEGLNTKIKLLKRQAFGFRDFDYFRLRVAFIHEATPAFPG